MSEGGSPPNEPGEPVLGMKKPAPAAAAKANAVLGGSAASSTGTRIAAGIMKAAPYAPKIHTVGRNHHHTSQGSASFRQANGLPNFQGMFLSMLANNSNHENNDNDTNSSQADFAAALSKHIRRKQQQKNNSNDRKRKAPVDNEVNNVIELDDSSSNEGCDGGPNHKRMRLEEDGDGEDSRKPAAIQQDASAADDKFINEFYQHELGGTMHADLDDLIVMGKGPNINEEESAAQLPNATMAAHRVPSPHNIIDTQQALEQQKEVMLRWFSERLNDLESTVQKRFAEKAHESNEAKAKTQRLEKRNQELTEKLQTLELDEIDKFRIEKAQREYLPARAKIRTLLLSKVSKTDRDAYIECTELLSDEIKKYAAYSTAVQDQMMLLQCRHFAEKSADRNTIAELEARLELAKEQAEQQNPGVTTTHGQYSTGESNEQIWHLEQQLAESEQAKTYLREQEASLLSSNHNLQTTLDQKHSENYDLQRKLQETAYQKTQVEQHVNSLQSQIEMLKINNAKQLQAQAVLMQRMNNDSTIRATQANAHLQQVVNLSSMTAQQAAALQAQCEQTLKEKEEEHQNEMRTTIKGHFGIMKSRTHRMEYMANQIKELCARNQKNEETMQQMALTINRLSASSAEQQNGDRNGNTEQNGNHNLSMSEDQNEGQDGNYITSRSEEKNGNDITDMSRSEEQKGGWNGNGMSRSEEQDGNITSWSAEQNEDQDGNNFTNWSAEQNGNHMLSRSEEHNGALNGHDVSRREEQYGNDMSWSEEHNGALNGNTSTGVDMDGSANGGALGNWLY